MKKLIIVLASMVVVTFLSCTSKPAPLTPEAFKVPDTGPAPVVKAGWEGEWERVQREAKKEGRLVLYTDASSELRRAFMEALRKYDINLEAISGRTADLVERLMRERKAGIYNLDLYISGITTYTDFLKPSGALVPLEPLLILPEVKDPKMWYKGELNFLDKERLILAYRAFLDPGIHVNTDIVKPGDIKSMQDLLSPRWKGKIIIEDPTTPGRGQRWMAIAALKLGEEYMRQLAKQEPLITRDMRLHVDWIAKGRYPIGLGVRPDPYLEYKKAGAPVTNLPLEDVSYLLAGIGHIGYMDRAPNPNASRVFVNWLLSREGQIIWQQFRIDQSARVDTPVDHLIKSGDPIRQPGVDYYDTRSEAWQVEFLPPGLKIVHEIFKPLVR